MLGLTIAVLAAGFVLVRVRSRRQFQRGGTRFVLVFVAFCAGVRLVGLASIQFGSARGRSLTALHASIRYRATGSGIFARLANRLLLDLPGAGMPANMAALADSCRDYAAAYDLVRPALPSQAAGRRSSAALFSFALPL